ncbi:MAG: hypothetical protein JXR64_02880 [Spirochaetales bacterium]|nr:hypothetical protein [Spirochaetales bacterium]
MSQTLLKKFIFKGNEVVYCPFKIKKEVIDNDYEYSTEPMNNGVFFETLCIGSGAKGNSITDLPRLRTGKKSIKQKRIESQVIEFNKDVKFYGIEINNYTTQKTFCKVWRGLEKYNIIVIFTGDIDILSPINYKGIHYPLATIDLKLSQDLKTTWGDFSWGDPKSMDHAQAYSYSWITNLVFFYMVYDYKPNMNKKMFKVNTDKVIMGEFFESVRKATAEYIRAEVSGWKKDNTLGLCTNCRVKECEYYQTDYNEIN